MINNENSSKSIENLTLQFTIDQNTAFELIEGSSICDHKLIFIRELLQNVMDATKLQIWKDIKKGKYGNVGESGYKIKNLPLLLKTCLSSFNLLVTLA